MKPSYDFPAFDSSSLINNFANERISFLSKNDLNIIILEKYENYGNSQINDEDSIEEGLYDDI